MDEERNSPIIDQGVLDDNGGSEIFEGGSERGVLTDFSEGESFSSDSERELSEDDIDEEEGVANINHENRPLYNVAIDETFWPNQITFDIRIPRGEQSSSPSASSRELSPPRQHPLAFTSLSTQQGMRFEFFAFSPRHNCIIEHVSLNESPKYHALSYTWEDPNLDDDFFNPDIDDRGPDRLKKSENFIHNEEHVSLDGQRMPVTRNLWCMLWHLRRKADWHYWNPDATISEFKDYACIPQTLKCVVMRDSWIWVDALSIGQSNIFERNEQVSKMMEIYQKAVCVHAWLGPAPPNLWLAVDAVLYSSYLEWNLRSEIDRHEWMAERFNEWIRGPKLEHAWSALIAVYSRPYWRRMWIIQELFANRCTVVDVGLRVLGFLPLCSVGLFVLENAAYNPGNPTPLEWRVKRSLPNLGISEDKANYSDPEFSGHDLFILLKMYRSLFSSRRKYNASVDTKAAVSFSQDGNIITCKGLFLGKFDKIHRFLDWRHSTDKDLPTYFHNLVSFLDKIDDDIPRGFWECDSTVDHLKILYDILFRAESSVRAEKIVSEEDFVEYCCLFENYRHQVYFDVSLPAIGSREPSPELADDEKPFPPPPPPPPPQPSQRIIRLTPLVIPRSDESRKFYKALSDVFVYTAKEVDGNDSTSKQGPVPAILGMCYTCCEEGDTIAILYGCKYPVVLRRVEGEIERYKVIGEVYAHGLMFGEALDEVFEVREWYII